MKDKRPSFQWYPQDYLSDINVARMSWEQRGVYLHLLCHCWIEGSIPSDLIELKQILSNPTVQLGPVVKCFAENPSESSQLIHLRLGKERQKQDANRKRAVESGKKGGMKRAENKRLVKGRLDFAIAECQANSSLSSSSSSSSSVKKKTISKVFKDDDPFRVTAGILFKLIRDHLPNAKKPDPNKWAETVRLIHEVDKKSLEEIEKLFEWASKDDFWRANILSPSKLRKKWDQLEVKMLSEKGHSGNGGGLVL